ncbi:hypothetical protein FRC17_009848 [Serendipita sp. 399]|nr:hypothetical protein FRC17_009848 [Serendipita sp. 399]
MAKGSLTDQIVHDNTVQFAFQVAWAAITTILFLLILFQLIRTQKSTSIPRRPYYLLALVAFLFVVSNVLGAVPLRTKVLIDTYLKMLLSSSMFADFVRTFTPGIILWLVHIRGAALYEARQGGGRGEGLPFVSQMWKRGIDWALVSITFILLIALHGYSLDKNLAFVRSRGHPGSGDRYLEEVKVMNRLLHGTAALILLLAINVIASLFALLAAQKRAAFKDPVINYLLILAAPFVFISAFSWLFFDIWSRTHPGYNGASNLAFSFIDGLSQVSIIAGVTYTVRIYAFVHPAASSSRLNQPSSGPERA